MKKRKQAIECGRCGEIRSEFLTEEEFKTLNDVAGPIYRDCVGCGKTTGWILSLRQTGATNNTTPLSRQSQLGKVRSVESRIIKGQERMATQAERDKVNSMVESTQQKN